LLLGYSSDAALQLKSARTYIEDKIATPLQSLWNREQYRHDRIRRPWCRVRGIGRERRQYGTPRRSGASTEQREASRRNKALSRMSQLCRLPIFK
jgi:hypothetical protein